MSDICTGMCDTCNIDHNAQEITTNRGHGISYSNIVKEYVYKTDYINRDENNNLILTTKDPDVYKGEWGSPACGDIVNIWVKLKPDSNIIIDAKYLSTGCWGSISSSSYGCELIIGKKLSEIDIPTLTLDIMQNLQLPPIKKHCSVFIGQCLEQIYQQHKAINGVLQEAPSEQVDTIRAEILPKIKDQLDYLKDK